MRSPEEYEEMMLTALAEMEGKNTVLSIKNICEKAKIPPATFQTSPLISDELREIVRETVEESRKRFLPVREDNINELLLEEARKRTASGEPFHAKDVYEKFVASKTYYKSNRIHDETREEIKHLSKESGATPGADEAPHFVELNARKKQAADEKIQKELERIENDIKSGKLQQIESVRKLIKDTALSTRKVYEDSFNSRLREFCNIITSKNISSKEKENFQKSISFVLDTKLEINLSPENIENINDFLMGAIARKYPDNKDKLDVFLDALANHMGKNYPFEHKEYKSVLHRVHNLVKMSWERASDISRNVVATTSEKGLSHDDKKLRANILDILKNPRKSALEEATRYYNKRREAVGYGGLGKVIHPAQASMFHTALNPSQAKMSAIQDKHGLSEETSPRELLTANIKFSQKNDMPVILEMDKQHNSILLTVASDIKTDPQKADMRTYALTLRKDAHYRSVDDFLKAVDILSNPAQIKTTYTAKEYQGDYDGIGINSNNKPSSQFYSLLGADYGSKNQYEDDMEPPSIAEEIQDIYRGSLYATSHTQELLDLLALSAHQIDGIKTDGRTVTIEKSFTQSQLLSAASDTDHEKAITRLLPLQDKTLFGNMLYQGQYPLSQEMALDRKLQAELRALNDGR